MKITKRGKPWFATFRDRGNYHFARGCNGCLYIVLMTGPNRGTQVRISRESDGGCTVYHGWLIKRCHSARQVLVALRYCIRDEARRQPRNWRAATIPAGR